MASIQRIEKLTPGEISKLPKDRRESMIQESAVHAIRESILNGNSNPANYLLNLLFRITKKLEEKEALIKFFEKWGNLYFSKSGTLKYTKEHVASIWTNEHEKTVTANPWVSLIEAPKRTVNTVSDADKEFRKVLARLTKVKQDPTKILLHAVLLEKVQEVLYAYGHSDEWTREDKRGRTLYDESTKMSPINASKYGLGM